MPVQIPPPSPMLALRPWAFPELTSWGRLPMSAIRHAETDGTPRIELDGEWRFELFGTPEAALTADGVPRAQAAVPGCWTMQDFDDVNAVADRPHYTNVQMPFRDLPPHPPAANPTGVYERDVELPPGWTERRVVLHVGAAESVLLVAGERRRCRDQQGFPPGGGVRRHRRPADRRGTCCG